MERIYQKIGRIREYLSLIESIKDECLTRFTTDPVYRGALLYYLYLLADSCISLAELVIRHKNLRIPQSYHETIDILGENKILEPGFAYRFARYINAAGNKKNHGFIEDICIGKMREAYDGS